jgi:probable rRNA maturation factor
MSPRFNVSIRNRQRAVSFDLAAVSALALQAGEACAKEKRLAAFAPADLSVVEISLVSDRRIAALHRQFLQLRGATDVITFEHGEIVISAAAAARGACEHGEPVERELCRYIVHGLLHLRGYEDDTALAQATMWRAQERILRRLWPEAGPATNVRKRVPSR